MPFESSFPCEPELVGLKYIKFTSDLKVTDDICTYYVTTRQRI